MIYLGLDYGSKTLGVSLSDKTGLIASSFEVIRYNDINNLNSFIFNLPVHFRVKGL